MRNTGHRHLSGTSRQKRGPPQGNGGFGIPLSLQTSNPGGPEGGVRLVTHVLFDI